MGNVESQEKELVFGSYKNQEKPRPGYYKTNCEVFYNGKKMNLADNDSFIKMRHGWAKDKSRVYYKGKTVRNADSDTFVIKSNVGYDKNGKWYMGKYCKS